MICEWCREKQAITQTALPFGKRRVLIHSCAGCNIRLKEELERVEMEKEAERKRKRELKAP